MKKHSYRSALCLLLTALSLISVAGCHSAQTASKDDEMNSAMSAQQKAVIAEHKRKAGD